LEYTKKYAFAGTQKYSKCLRASVSFRGGRQEIPGKLFKVLECIKCALSLVCEPRLIDAQHYERDWAAIFPIFAGG
jgi:hypothetical protein